ncbi:MAG: hypothetical protein FWE31_05845 [Firmicutes bacterium]|nr:hypothetical protein [Bacillota bacterium]
MEGNPFDLEIIDDDAKVDDLVGSRNFPLIGDSLLKYVPNSSKGRILLLNDILASWIVAAVGHNVASVKAGRRRKNLYRVAENILKDDQVMGCFEYYDASRVVLPDDQKLDFLRPEANQNLDIELTHRQLSSMDGIQDMIDEGFFSEDVRRYLSLILTMDSDSLEWRNCEFIKTLDSSKGDLSYFPAPIYDGEFLGHGVLNPIEIPKRNLNYFEREYPHILENFGIGLGNVEENLDKIFDHASACHLVSGFVSASKIKSEFLIKRKSIEKQIGLLHKQMGVAK